MGDNLGLLFDAVASQWLPRPQRIAILALHRAKQRHEPPAARLALPDVGHFVDEMSLRCRLRQTEIVAIGLPAGMEVQMPGRRHRHLEPNNK